MRRPLGFRREFVRERRTGQRILKQRKWFRLLPLLGYVCQPANHLLEDGSEVPILCAVGNAGGNAASPRLLVIGAVDPRGEDEDPLTLKPHRLQFHGEAPPAEAVLSETWNTIVTRASSPKTAFSEGTRTASPYRHLKLVMDYRCALWFWPIAKADCLPSRDEFRVTMTPFFAAELSQD